MTVQNPNCATCADAYVVNTNSVGQFFGEVATRIAHWWKTRQKHHENRLAIRQMLELDDKNLRDIGISRADLIWANSLPLGENATLELQKIARRDW